MMFPYTVLNTGNKEKESHGCDFMKPTPHRQALGLFHSYRQPWGYRRLATYNHTPLAS